ncbi:MAG: UbiA family prenyltransferase [Planctomycetes bacterium]|jgi:4-hydroxybenzoate polyprenyltransferase|nr:UbiA family prenyltransferase [Planctomycetota bacterium]MCL4728830.1 putative 4-hydroxybenzoate polyprenyltransferase [Planctomycetota bacterium]
MSAGSSLAIARTYASFVKLAHTVFALPFALVGMSAAYAVPTTFVYPRHVPGMGPGTTSFDQHMQFSWLLLALILCCMVGARTFAMALNRIIDRRIDALNPRTMQRELPARRISLGQAWTLALAAAGLYFGACFTISPVVFWLSPVPILLMAVYPYMKRISALCHLVLGASLGLAPVGAWVAVRAMSSNTFDNGELFFAGAGWRAGLFGQGPLAWGLGWDAVGEPAPWVLGAGVMLWVAGFDIIYALQDDEFDRANRLHSIPAAVGRRAALWISRAMHLGAAACFFGCIWLLTHPAPVGGMDTRQYTQLADWVWAAPCVMLAGLVYQHSLVKPGDLSRVNMAFFTVNGVISVAFGAAFLAAWLTA